MENTSIYTAYDRKVFRDRIKQRRNLLGMTQEELAKKVGYASKSSISKIETERSISRKRVEKIAAALDTTPAYIMGWTDDPDVSNNANNKGSGMSFVEFVRAYLSLDEEKKLAVINLLKDGGGNND